MKKICSLLLFSIATFSVNAQAWQWAKSAGGTTSDDVTAVTRDNSINGSVYTTGYFYSSSITFGGITLNNAGDVTKPDMFIAKYDANGNVIWAKNVGGSNYVRAYTIEYVNWNVFVAGMFSGTVTFGSTTLTSVGGADLFIVQYDVNGNVLWATSVGGGGNDGQGCRIKYLNPGFVITGYSSSTSLTIGSTTLTLSGSGDGFIARYDSINCGGNTFCWAKSILGSSAADVATANNGDVVITGGFYNTVTLGSTTLTSVGGGDIFVAKYNNSGTLLWAKREGSTNDESGTAIVIPPNSTDIYFAGQFGSTSSMSTSTIIGSTTLNTVGPDQGGFWYRSDLFFAKLDAVGNVQWVKGMHGIDDERVSDMSSNFNQDIFLVGGFTSSFLAFDSDTVLNTVTTSPSSYDVYIAKYDPNGNFIWAESVGGSGHDGQTCRISNVYGNVAYIAGDFQSSSITIGDSTLTNAGSTDAFLAKLFDCNITVVSQSASICNGDSIFLQNAYQTSSGIYYDTLLASSGCDSIIQTTLSINSFSTYDTLLICGNDSAFLQGGYQSSSGNYYDTLTAISGCDSILITSLNVNSVSIYDTTYVTVNDTVLTYDTIPVYDTTFVTVTDTTYITVNDTNFVTVTDTTYITINDTNFVTVTDTTYITVNDTNFVTVTDTTYITVNDTVPIYDTTFVSITDTTFITVSDTNFVTVTDTTYITVNDTNFVTITDTNFITVNDTNYVTVFDSIAVTDTLFIDVNTGLIQPNDITTIKVFPNPAKTQVTIETGNFALLNNYKISIENSIGQQVFFSLIDQQQFVIDLSDWTGNGTYFVKILNGQNIILDVRKIILQ